MFLRFLLILAACCCARCSLASDVKTDSDRSASETSKDVIAGKQKFFFGLYSTLTQTVVAFTTSTVHISCINNGFGGRGVVPGPAPPDLPPTNTRCTGRRQRKQLDIALEDK